MSWIVDNASTLYLLLGILAAGMVAIWWLNKRIKFLGYAAGVLVLIGLVWLVTQFFISDSKQLELNVHAMADAVVAGKVDDLFKHISKDFRYKEFDRDLMYAGVKKSVGAFQVTNVRISSFDVKEVSRAKKFAKTSFNVNAAADREIMFRMEADFVLEGEQWKLKTVRFYMPLGDQEMDLLGLR